MSRKKPVRCSKCCVAIPEKDTVGREIRECQDCRELQRLRTRRRCAGWIDAKGKKHECDTRLTDYRCEKCWKKHLAAHEESWGQGVHLGYATSLDNQVPSSFYLNEGYLNDYNFI